MQIISPFKHTTKHVLGLSIRDPLHITKCGLYLALASSSQILIYDPSTNQQLKFISHSHSSSNQISTIAATQDGTKIAVAESIEGSVISIYNLEQEGESIEQPEYVLKGHRVGVNHLTWSTNGRYLVSMSNEDGGLFVWEGRSRVSQNKISKKINKIIFKEDGNMVTIGAKHFNIWPFNKGQIIRRQNRTSWMMDSKTVTLGNPLEQKEFFSVAEKNNKLAAITADGILCIINNDKCQKAVDLKMTNARGIDIYQNWVLCGGSNAIIKIIHLDTLKLVSTFPKPPPNNQQNILQKQQTIDTETSYSPCTSITVINSKIITLYQTGMTFVWQFKNSTLCSVSYLMGHSNDITCLSLLEQIPNQVTFLATSSLDRTIRVYYLIYKYYNDNQPVDLAQIIDIKRNIYSKSLIRVIYCNQVIEYIRSTPTLMIACSKSTIYVYSLSTYDVLFTHTINQSTINTIQIQNNQLYIALSNRTVNIYGVSETMLEHNKIFEVAISVEMIKVMNNKIMVLSGESAVMFVDIEGDKVYKQERGVLGMDLVRQKEVYYLMGNTLYVYNLLKNKEKEYVSLKKEFSTDKLTLKIIDSFILTLSTLDKTRSHLQIYNHQGDPIHSRVFLEPIQDITLSQDGACVIAYKSGPIVVQKFSYREKFAEVERQFKENFTQQNLSWSSNSIWTSQALNKNMSNMQDLLVSVNDLNIPSASKIQSYIVQEKQSEEEGKGIYYKNSNQRSSLFSPSLISEQLNNVMENISKYQHKSNLKTIRLDDVFGNEGQLAESIGPESIQPKVNNFLEVNIVDKVEKAQKEKSNEKDKMRVKSEAFSKIKIHEQYDYQKQDKEHDTKKSRINEEKLAIDELLIKLEEQNFINQNKEKLRTIYNHLHGYFGHSNEKTIKEIEKISGDYVANLQVLLKKL